MVFFVMKNLNFRPMPENLHPCICNWLGTISTRTYFHWAGWTA